MLYYAADIDACVSVFYLNLFHVIINDKKGK